MKNLLIGLLAITSVSVFAARPTLEIDFSGMCVCSFGVSLSGPSYKAFCQNKKHLSLELYVTTNVGSKISMNPDFISDGEQFGSLYNWCNMQLAEQTTNPKCVLSLEYKGHVVWVDLQGNKGSNNFRANVDKLPRNTEFEVRLIETTSGAKSMPALLLLK
jgi:hypothetical protein